jgi:hypothetical protein
MNPNFKELSFISNFKELCNRKDFDSIKTDIINKKIPINYLTVDLLNTAYESGYTSIVADYLKKYYYNREIYVIIDAIKNKYYNLVKVIYDLIDLYYILAEYEHIHDEKSYTELIEWIIDNKSLSSHDILTIVVNVFELACNKKNSILISILLHYCSKINIDEPKLGEFGNNTYNIFTQFKLYNIVEIKIISYYLHFYNMDENSNKTLIDVIKKHNKSNSTIRKIIESYVCKDVANIICEYANINIIVIEVNGLILN